MTVCKYQKEYQFILFPVGMAIITWFAIDPPEGYGKYFIWLFCCLLWFFYLFNPYKVELLENNEFIFTGILRKTKISAEDIISISERREYHLDPGAIIIKHKNGKVRLNRLMDNVYDLKRKLLSINPEIQIK